MKNFLAIVLFFAVSQVSYGQSTVNTNANTDSNTITNTVQAPEVAKPSSILKHVIAGLKSQNNSGRVAELNSEKGRTIQAKQEVWLGYKHDSGWGLFGLYATTYNNYKDDAKTKWSLGDPSATLVHPAWYSDGNLRVTGKLRRYFPESDYSKAHGMRQTAYYLDATYKMSHGQEIYNNLTARKFTYDNHGPANTDYYVEDTTNYTKTFAKDFRWGVGHWTQYESHYNTSPGLSIELVPQMDYMLTPSTFMGPRIRLPVVAENSVLDGPKAVKWNQAYFQFFVLMNL
jgi:hypothetical protein